MPVSLMAFPIRISRRTHPQFSSHVHEFHELVCCTAGQGHQTTSRGLKPIAKGDLFFFPAGEIHNSFCFSHERFSLNVLYFGDELFSEGVDGDRDAIRILSLLKTRGGREPKLCLSEENSGRMAAAVQKTVLEDRQKQLGCSLAMKMSILEILLTLARDPVLKLTDEGFHDPPSREDQIRAVCMYLEAHYYRPVRVNDLLEFCPLSRSHFHATFRRYCGKTVIEYLTEIRLKKACTLLQSTADPAGRIAADTGFSSSSHFCHTFKTALGLSPREYRRQQGSLHFNME